MRWKNFLITRNININLKEPHRDEKRDADKKDQFLFWNENHTKREWKNIQYTLTWTTKEIKKEEKINR